MVAECDARRIIVTRRREGILLLAQLGWKPGGQGEVRSYNPCPPGCSRVAGEQEVVRWSRRIGSGSGALVPAERLRGAPRPAAARIPAASDATAQGTWE